MPLVGLSFVSIKGSLQFNGGHLSSIPTVEEDTQKDFSHIHIPLKMDEATDDATTQVFALLQSAMRQCNVARRLNLSGFSVRRVYQWFLETVGYVRRHGSSLHLGER